jgi:hypothetical protein
METKPRPNMALAWARASLACNRLFLAMHGARHGCADCGYGFRACPRTRTARLDADRLAVRIADLEGRAALLPTPDAGAGDETEKDNGDG